MRPISSQQISGIIIAGGLGQRMGSNNKGLQLLHGKPMISHVIDKIEQQVSTLMMNVNHNIEKYAIFQRPLIQDIFPDYAGPLAGIHAGLVHCHTDYLLCVPCDVPFLPENLVPHLADTMSQSGADIVVACTNENAQIKSHPIICLMKKTVCMHLEKYLQQGGKKVHAWQAELNTKQVIFDDVSAFRNLNYAEELSLANANYP